MSTNCLRYKLFIASVLMISASPAFAQGFKVDPKRLPDATQIERAPREIQILGPRVRVKDFRTAEEDESYMINVGPSPQAQHRVIQIGNPAGAAGGDGGGSNVIPISRNGLPRAGFESNMGSLPASPAGNLPDGRTRNALERVAAQRIPHDSPKGSRVSQKGLLPAPHQTTQAPSTQAATYRQDTSPAASSGWTTTKTDVTGTLKRGGLIKQAQ